MSDQSHYADQASAHAEWVRRTIKRTPAQRERTLKAELDLLERKIDRQERYLSRGQVPDHLIDRAERRLERLQAEADRIGSELGYDVAYFAGSDGDSDPIACASCGRPFRDRRDRARGMGLCASCDPWHPDHDSSNDPNRPKRSHL